MHETRERPMNGQDAARPRAGMVTFVGAGPGDPELVTVKGRKAIETADLVLYAGSLGHFLHGSNVSE